MATWVIADIHGCFNTFRKLIEDKIQLSKSDTLILLGDYIDRGPNSKAVVDYIIELKNNNYHLITLKGNHEEILLRSYDETQQPPKGLFKKQTNKSQKLWLMYGGIQTLESFRIQNISQLSVDYLDFFRNLTPFYQTPTHIFVHAGLNFEINDPLTDTETMMWIREFYVDPQKINYRTVVHGHVPVTIDLIKEAIQNKHFYFIDLDNGCVYNQPHMNNLVALNIEKSELLIQPNIES